MSWLPRDLAHQGKSSMIWASLKYPPLACTITEKEGDTITRELSIEAFYPNWGQTATSPTYTAMPPHHLKVWKFCSSTLSKKLVTYIKCSPTVPSTPPWAVSCAYPWNRHSLKWASAPPFWRCHLISMVFFSPIFSGRWFGNLSGGMQSN